MQFKLIPIASLALSGCMFSFSSYAEDSIGIEEIVVTARKQEESAQDIPVALTALTEELTRSTVRDLTDLNGFAPNVQIGEDGGRAGGGASITIRGISPTRTDDNSFDSPIGVMVDGIYLGSLAGQVMENFDLERIEILRGPQGTLFGKNTVGGVVHVIRSRPTGELGARFKVTHGEDDQRELRAVVNASLIEDKLAAKFFGTVIRDDGWLDNITTGGSLPVRDYQNYGVSFLWTPNDRFEALLTVENFKDESELGAYHTNANYARGVLPVPTDPNDTDYSGGFTNCTMLNPQVCRRSTEIPDVAENDTRNEAELDTDAVTLTMKYELNENMTLVSVTGYRELIENRIYDFDGSSAPYITIDRRNDYDQLSQELRIDGAWNDITMTAGLYYFNNEFEQDWVTGGRFWAGLFGGVAYTPPVWATCQAGAFAPIWCDQGLTPSVEPGGDVTQILYETQETTSYAAFAQVDWRFADKWTLTAGLRWTEEEKDFIAGQAYLSNVARQWGRNFPTIDGQPGFANLDNTWTETSPKVGLTYDINDDSIVYLSYAEGFHSGGFFGVNQNIRDFVRDQYDPELAKSWELGYKSLHFDNRLKLNLTYFHNDFEDKQEQSVQVDPDTLTVATTFDNVATAIYKGWELETEFVVNQYVKLFFNYGYLDAEYEDFMTDINASDGVMRVEDASHLAPRNAPENTLGIGGTLTVPLTYGALEFYTKWSQVSEVETNLLNAPQARLDEREDLQASIGYFTESWSVVAFGRNLTDEEFEIFIPIATLFAVGTLNRPRTFGIEFQFEI